MISEPPHWESHKDAPISGNWLRRKFKSWFRYVDYPFLMAYRGFGSPERVIVQGYVFKGMALSKPSKRGKSLKNLLNLIKMFLVRTVPETTVKIAVHDKTFSTKTDPKGFFEFDLKNQTLSKGWHQCRLWLAEELVEGQDKVETTTKVCIADKPAFVVVSDIDDTLLVSHITKTLRKIYLLITRNSETRKPFKGTVHFYQKLHNNSNGERNPFFFVSSSEWNLYEFLIRFMDFHKIPKGVLQLKDLKDHWTDFFRSGYGSHNHKAEKIERLMELYPELAFVLIGDNGQQDAKIYQQLATNYPNRIKAIYIRKVRKSTAFEVNEILQNLEHSDLHTLQFKHSRQAEEHARHIGLID